MSNSEELAALVALAESAQSRDWPRAALLAAELRGRFPDVPSGYHTGAVASRALGLLDAAAAILVEATARFSAQSWPIQERAWVAKARGDADETLRLAAELRSRFPDNAAGYRIALTFLRDWRRLDDVEAVLREAASRFPTQSWPAREVAEIRANRTRAAHLVEVLREARRFVTTSPTHRNQTSDKVFVVLGMHRAGTSLCTRIIERLGVALGEPLLQPAYDNPDGFQEHASILECHEALLHSCDADWDTFWSVKQLPDGFWSSEPAIAARERMKRIVAEQLRAANGTWAFKDPRTARLLPLWKAVFADLGIAPVWILAVRHPGAVANSLLARNGVPPAMGELLWTEHYLDALRHLGPQIGTIIHYERWFSAPLAQARELAALIGRPAEDGIESAFRSIRPQLRHNTSSHAEGSLPLAKDLHSWMSDARPDLRRIQHRASAAWQELENIAGTRGLAC